MQKMNYPKPNTEGECGETPINRPQTMCLYPISPREREGVPRWFPAGSRDRGAHVTACTMPWSSPGAAQRSSVLAHIWGPGLSGLEEPGQAWPKHGGTMQEFGSPPRQLWGIRVFPQ